MTDNLLDHDFPLGTVALAGYDTWLFTHQGWVCAGGDYAGLTERLRHYTIIYEPTED